jgi:superfamily II DNA or RNA helicase
MDTSLIKPYYRSGTDDLRKDFFEPILSRSVRYKRASGFFSTSALLSWGKAIIRMVNSDHLFTSLLISPNLSEEDFSALDRCITPTDKEELFSRKANEIISLALGLDESNTLKDDVQIILSWLITTGKLEVKFAFPSHVDSPGLFHEKIGIVEIETGEKVAFTGSANESISGHSLNYETVDVFRGWVESEKERVSIKEIQFDEAWNAEAPGLIVRELSSEILEKVKVRSSQYPHNEEGWEIDEGPLDEDIFDTLLPGVSMYKHQREAILGWENNNFQGLFEMCTGAGKTITALAGLNYLKREVPVSVVVIACPSRLLVDQWIEELDKYDFSLIIKAYDSFSGYESDLNHLLYSGVGGIIVCTYSALLDGEKFAQLLRFKSIKNALLIADEVHNCNKKRIKRLQEFDASFPWRIALSATPEREREPDVTALMKDFFKGHTPVVEYSLKDAIDAGVLCKYKYMPVPIFLAKGDGAGRYAEVLESLSEKYDKGLQEEKTNILCNVDLYINDIGRIIDNQQPLSHMLIFCPPGFKDREEEHRYIDHIADFLSNKSVNFTSITAENSSKSSEPLEGFRNGSYQVLLGVGCLDEGFSVPSITSAVMLYSNDSRKQFVQRRGRALRKYKGKDFSVIYDMILLPYGLDLPASRIERIIEKEMKRYREFADLSMDPANAQKILDNAFERALGSKNV